MKTLDCALKKHSSCRGRVLDALKDCECPCHASLYASVLAEVGHEIEELAIRIAAISPVDPVDVAEAFREKLEEMLEGL